VLEFESLDHVIPAEWDWLVYWFQKSCAKWVEPSRVMAWAVLRSEMRGGNGALRDRVPREVRYERCVGSDDFLVYGGGAGGSRFGYFGEKAVLGSGLDSQSCEFAGAHEYAGKHWPVEPSGVGIAQRGMVAAEEMEAIGQDVLGAVGEAVVGPSGYDSGVEQVGEVAIPGDFAEADDDSDAGQSGDLSGEMLGAVTDLLGERFVARRGATDDGGDPGVAEFEAVVAGDGFGPGGEAQVMEDGIHEVAGAVAGEGTAGAVGTVGAGGESKNQDPCAGISEARDRACPVGLVLVGATASFADSAAIVSKSRAAFAGDDGLVNLLED
jgi:hypothetical protein